MTLAYALCKVAPIYFQKSSQDAAIGLQLIRESSHLSSILIKYNFKTAASRLIGAYEYIGNKKLAENLAKDLIVFGWKIKGENPFTATDTQLPVIRIQSPYVGRIVALWSEYRKKVIEQFPQPPGLPKNPEEYLAKVSENYERDAYNSLSIEGYHVNEELILRVQNNHWNPDINPKDSQERDALAARGYFEAFQAVKKSVKLILEGKNPGVIIEKDLQGWYQNLFSPSAKTGLMNPHELLGYRKEQVYIRNSRHIPLPKEAIYDAMESLFMCLKEETHAAVRAVLGHYIFVYIHPYMDGNGRLARFIMNAMCASGGYPWTIVHIQNRNEYLNALEAAGPGKDIVPFAKFIAKEMVSGL